MLTLFADTAILVISALVYQSVTQTRRGRFITYELNTVTSTSATVKQDLANSWTMMVFEKIGTELRLVKLHNHKIRRGQGYLFGEPRESKRLPSPFKRYQSVTKACP